MADAILKHAWFSPYLDGPQTTKLQPSAWNAALLLSGGADGDLLVADALSATGGSWLSPAALKTTLGLDLVENTALSTWAGSVNLVTLGTLLDLTVTNPIVGSVTGNAATATLAAAATILQTARTINGVSFDGSGNITVDAAAGTLTGAALAANVLASSLTSVGTLASLAVTGNIQSARVLVGDGTALLPALSFVSTPTLGFWRSSAGAITATGGFVASYLNSGNVYVGGTLGSSVYLTGAANGLLNVQNSAGSTGVGVDVLTDAILKVRTRAHTGYATVDALGYRASGAAGISFSGAITNLTIVNGIVTAAS